MTANEQSRLLICFDGSEGAAHAIEAAARLFPGANATVVFTWHAPLPYGGISYGGQIVLPAEIQQQIEASSAEEAQKTVANGVALAQGAGLNAVGEARETTGPAWRALLAAAEDADAGALVVGSRGHGELRALMLGSTSVALSHHSRRPLLIVPSEP